ncbi:MAG: DUF1292 domain-containing protein [Myxococcota bacterium]
MAGSEDENGEGHVHGFDDSEEITDDDVMVFEDENGVEREGLIVAVIEHEGVDYAVVQPLDQLTEEDGDDEEDEIETYVFTVMSTAEGEVAYGEVEDEAAFNAVCDAFSELMDTVDDED